MPSTPVRNGKTSGITTATTSSLTNQRENATATAWPFAYHPKRLSRIGWHRVGADTCQPATDACEFLKTLDSPDDSDSDPEHPAWIWRGQSQPWPLFPSAYREESWRRFGRPTADAHDPRSATLDQQQRAEREILSRFYESLNLSALPVPGDECALLSAANSGFQTGQWPGDKS